MIVTKLELTNWKNFREVEFSLAERLYFIGANASGKSNLLDVFRFLRDVAHPKGGGLQRALEDRGGLKKIRCLAARKNPEVRIVIHLSGESDGPKEWRYELALKHEASGLKRTLIHHESVHCNGTMLLSRPDTGDASDSARLTQTALQDERSNASFRELADFLRAIVYLHVVPQFIQHSERIGGFKLQFDPFGQELLERIAKTPERTRTARLARIERGLKSCIPHLSELQFESDTTNGKPHLKAKYQHWRPNGGWQTEDQFSDGTLRIIGLLWTLLEGGKMLLLEEPELSLDSDIVAQLPRLIRQMQKAAKHTPQVLVTTHSESLLNAVDGSEVRRLSTAASGEGTQVVAADDDEIKLLRSGFSTAEVMLPKVHSNVKDLQQARLFEM